MIDIKELETILKNDKFIINCCLSYRHDFGLLNKKEQQFIIFQCKEWFHAIINNLPYHKG
jgi:hypothetical protein